MSTLERIAAEAERTLLAHKKNEALALINQYLDIRKQECTIPYYLHGLLMHNDKCLNEGAFHLECIIDNLIRHFMFSENMKSL